MINWAFIFGMTFGVVFATEFRRYRMAKRGISEFLVPIWEHRLLTLLGVLAAAFACEFARIALESPTKHHVWYLIFAAAFAAIFMAVQTGRELSLTKKELKKLQSGKTI